MPLASKTFRDLLVLTSYFTSGSAEGAYALVKSVHPPVPAPEECLSFAATFVTRSGAGFSDSGRNSSGQDSLILSSETSMSGFTALATSRL